MLESAGSMNLQPRPGALAPTDSYRRDEAIAAARDCLDVFWTSTLITQGSSQHEDVLREVRFLDKRIGPNFLQQLIFLHQLHRRSSTSI